MLEKGADRNRAEKITGWIKKNHDPLFLFGRVVSQ